MKKIFFAAIVLLMLLFSPKFIPGTIAEGPIILETPTTLTPAYGNECSTSWKKFTNNRGHPFYLTLNTNKSSSATNSGIWRPNLPHAGQYKVEAYVGNHGLFSWPCPPPNNATVGYDTSDARYKIYHAGGSNSVTGNQRPLENQWLTLGTFEFNSGTGGYVKLVDLNGETNLSRTISFGAMRFTFVGTLAKISGQVADKDGNPISGVTISDGGSHSATTDASGNYTIGSLLPGTYNLTASKSDYRFSPTSLPVTVSSADATGQNFVATRTYSISGKVTDGNGNPISGVPLVIKWASWLPPAATVTTDSNGNYTFSGLSQVKYLLTAKSGSLYTLSPKARSITAPAINQNFTTTPIYGTLKGRVTASGKAIANARVSVGGKVVSTNSNGDYSVQLLLPGNPAIRVSAQNYKDYKGSAKVVGNATTWHDVALTPIKVDGYWLPYPGGKRYTCTQGGNNQAYSHSGNARHATDWGMTIGTPIVAARDGKVYSVKESSNYGCNNSSCSSYTNWVAIEHSDGSISWYFHLKYGGVSVSKGARVKSGQIIGYSGNTGWRSGPHLHYERRGSRGSRRSIKTPFLDVLTDGGFPQAGRRYTSGNYLTSSLSEVRSMADVISPTGEIQIQMTGTPTYTLKVYAFDYDSDTIEMKLATNEGELQSAVWKTISETVDWTWFEAWSQFRDETGNISKVYSSTVEAINYESIQAAFTITPTICVGQIPEIENLTIPLCEQCGWEWDMGDGNTGLDIEFALPYPYIGYEEAGVYTVALTATNADSVSSASKQIEALAVSSSAFTITQSGTTITVEADATDASAWQWDFGDGITATGRIATHTYTSTEILEQSPIVQLIVENSNGCAGISHQYVSVQTSNIYLPIVIKNN